LLFVLGVLIASQNWDLRNIVEIFYFKTITPHFGATTIVFYIQVAWYPFSIHETVIT